MFSLKVKDKNPSLLLSIFRCFCMFIVSPKWFGNRLLFFLSFLLWRHRIEVGGWRICWYADGSYTYHHHYTSTNPLSCRHKQSIEWLNSIWIFSFACGAAGWAFASLGGFFPSSSCGEWSFVWCVRFLAGASGDPWGSDGSSPRQRESNQ